MSFLNLQITNTGESAMIGVINHLGSGLNFTNFQIGNGDPPEHPEELTALVNPVTSKIAITDFSVGTNYVDLTFSFDNALLETGFYWRELGVFAEDYNGDEILFGYANAGDMAEYIPPNTSAFVVDDEYTVRIIMSSTENVTATVTGQTYVPWDIFNAHINDFNNPHRVTKEQVGLGNVPNLAPNNLTITYTEASAPVAMQSGEKLSNAFAKIAAAITSLLAHIRNTVVHITAEERSAWNGKADANHTHAAAHITSGTLGIARGGTGYSGSTLAGLKSYLGIGEGGGTYVASDTTPSSTSVLWINTAEYNTLYYYNSDSSSWEPVSAQGGVVRSTVAPTNHSVIWIDLSVGGIAKYYDETVTPNTWKPIVAVWGSNS